MGNSTKFNSMTKDINHRYALWFTQRLSENYRSGKQLLFSEAVRPNNKCVLDKRLRAVYWMGVISHGRSVPRL